MSPKRLKSAFGAGLVYFALESLGGLVLIPTMARYLPVENVGSWILFIAFIPLVPLSISGFAPLVVREIAAARAVSDGDRIRSLIVNARRRTRIAAVSLIAILLVCYGYFIYPIRNGVDANVSLAWLLFCVALLARLDVLRSFAVINGFGRVGVDKLQMSIGSFLILAGSLLLVVAKKDLVALGLLHMSVYAIVLLIARRTEYRIVNSLNISTKHEVPTTNIIRTEVFKMYLVSVGGFLTMNTDVFIAKKIVSGPVFVEYALVSRFALALIAIAALYIQIHFPQVSALAKLNQSDEFDARVRKIQRIVTIAAALAGLVISVAYPWIIEAALGHSSLLPPSVIYFLIVFAVLCVHIIAVGQGIIATGDSHLAHIALPAAVGGFTCAIMAVNVWGLIGIPAGLSFALLASAMLHEALYRNRLQKMRRSELLSHA